VIAADPAAIEEQCGPLYEEAKESAMSALGMAVGEAQKAAREMCSADGANESACQAKPACTYCAGNSTCWPVIDQDNPCHSLAVNAVIFGATAAKDIAVKLGEGLDWAVSQCSNMDEDTCTAGFNGNMCNWCNTTRSCHTKGSVLDECVRDDLINIAYEAGSEAAKQATELIKQRALEQYAAEQAYCANETGQMKSRNESSCAAEAKCIWCAAAGKADVNTCYFLGDLENECVKWRISQFVDAAGKLKPVGDWFSSQWKNAVTWGQNLCGKHVDASKDVETNTETCTADKKCYWCDDDQQCYIYGDVGSPCGTAQKGKDWVVNKWNDLWGNGATCSNNKVTAYETMKEGMQLTLDNLAVACKELASSEVYASRTMVGLQTDLGNAASAASELASIQLQKARRALIDAAVAINASTKANTSITAFEETNPCVTDDLLSAGSMRGPAGMVAYLAMGLLANMLT
jgi:hypothetical protein